MRCLFLQYFNLSDTCISLIPLLCNACTSLGSSYRQCYVMATKNVLLIFLTIT